MAMRWIKSHSENVGNERADALAKVGTDIRCADRHRRGPCALLPSGAPPPSGRPASSAARPAALPSNAGGMSSSGGTR
eukprot:5750189-Pyramimonas_sp.AAC.1